MLLLKALGVLSALSVASAYPQGFKKDALRGPTCAVDQVFTAGYTPLSKLSDPAAKSGKLWHFGPAYTNMDAGWAKAAGPGVGGQQVCVVDSGVNYQNTDIKANLPYFPSLPPVKGAGYHEYCVNFLGVLPTQPGNNDCFDEHGHGTFVAGVIAAVANNAVDSVGMAPGSKIVACKFMGASGYGDLKNVIRCLGYCMGRATRIINLSFAMYADPDAKLLKVMTRAAGLGSLMVVAAGNDGRNLDAALVQPVYPAMYATNLRANVLSVGALTKANALWPKSNYGNRTVEILAPGESVTSLSRVYGVTQASGTSFACPMVAAVAEVILDAWRVAGVNMASTSLGSLLKQALLQGARLVTVPVPGVAAGQTYRVLDAGGAMGVANSWTPMLLKTL